MTGDGTTSVHGGEAHGPDDGPRSGPLTTPIERASAYRFASTADLVAASSDGADGFYARYGHPNFAQVESKFAALHRAQGAVLFASGMATVAAIVHAFCSAGDRIVAMADCYGGTRALLDRLAERGFVSVAYIGRDERDDIRDHVAGASLVLGEAPTNPLLRVADVAALAEVCRAAGVRFALDATFAGPANFKPLAHGVDLVFESATKSLGGHSDLMGGLVAGSADDSLVLGAMRRLFGAVPDPETAWLLDRGLKTYPVRAARQAETALALARGLEDDARVRRVWHLGLESHPDHRRAKHLGVGPGSMLAFECVGDAVRCVDALRLVANAPSLGGVESLACLPRLTSHAYLTPAAREALGISDDLIRFSVGLEDEADLRADLDRALSA